jgi:hypothetical protein
MIDKLNSAIYLSPLANRGIEKEKKDEKIDFGDGFQRSSSLGITGEMDIKNFQELKEMSQNSEKTTVKDSGNLITGTSGTIVQFAEENPVQTIKPSTPLYEIFPGVSKEETKKIAESLICEGGLDPKVKATIIRDLSAFPLPVLRLLKNDQLDIVVVKEGQSLADTSFLTVIKPEEYQTLAEKGKVVFADVVKIEAANTEKEIEEEKKKGNDDPFHIGMIHYWASERIEETLSKELIKENLGFTVINTREPVNLKEFAEKHNVDEENYEDWEKTLRMINGDQIEIKNGMIETKNGVFLSPYTYYKGKPVSETTLKSLKGYDSKNIKDALGIHNWESRLVLLHEEYAGDPAKEVGHYRIVLHECGHALDHCIERIAGKEEEHRKFVDSLYQKDKDELKKSGKNNFISPRAMDSVREYFAEAVESYLTVVMGDSQDYYKPDDNHNQLKKLNPELFAYIDTIMKTDFPADLIPAAPVKEPDPVKE